MVGIEITYFLKQTRITLGFGLVGDVRRISLVVHPFFTFTKGRIEGIEVIGAADQVLNVVPARFTELSSASERAGDEVVVASTFTVASDFLFHCHLQGSGALLQLTTVLDGDAAAFLDGDLIGFSNHTSGDNGVGLNAYILIGGGQLGRFPVVNIVPITVSNKDQDIVHGGEEGSSPLAYIFAANALHLPCV